MTLEHLMDTFFDVSKSSLFPPMLLYPSVKSLLNLVLGQQYLLHAILA